MLRNIQSLKLHDTYNFQRCCRIIKYEVNCTGLDGAEQHTELHRTVKYRTELYHTEPNLNWTELNWIKLTLFCFQVFYRMQSTL